MLRRGLAAGEVADEHAVLDERHVLGRHALVVVAERAEPARRGGIGVDVDVLAPVAQAVELVGRQEAGAGEAAPPCRSTRSSSVGWPHDSWIWSATWVESEDEVHLAGRALRRVEQRDRQLRGLLRVLGEVQCADGLEAAGHDLSAGGVGVAALLHLALVDRGGLDPAAGLDDLLLDPGAGRGGEGLALAPRDRCCPRGWRRRARRAIAASASIRMRSLSSRLTANGILAVRRAVRIGHGRRVVELDRLAFWATPEAAGDLECLASDPVRLGRLKDGARAEAPRAVDAGRGCRIRRSGSRWRPRAAPFLTVSSSLLAFHDADVGVIGAAAGRRRPVRVRSGRSRRHQVLYGVRRYRLPDSLGGTRRPWGEVAPGRRDLEGRRLARW